MEGPVGGRGKGRSPPPPGHRRVNLNLSLFRKLLELFDAIYRIELASLGSNILNTFCHILTKNLLVRNSVPMQKLVTLNTPIKNFQ